MIIDVREKIEYLMGHVDGAVNIPPADILNGARKLDGVPKDTQLILYCRTGSRSAVAAGILQDMGYSDVVNGVNKDVVKARYM